MVNMAELLENLFFIVCLALLAWGLIRRERIYQYPFFMGAIFIAFIRPQATAIIGNPGVVSQPALERVLLFSCLCAAASWLGYQLKPNANWIAKFHIPLNQRRLFEAGLILLSISYACNFVLSRITIQVTATGTWTGPATILVFFAQVIYIAFTIFLLRFLQKPSIANVVWVALASIQPLNDIILVGRRQPTMTFLIIIGLCFWLVRRSMPPRWVFIIAVTALVYVIPLVGELRGDFWMLIFQRDWQAIINASQQSFDNLRDGEVLELRNAAVLMDAAEKSGQYGFGTGFWDRLVFQYVPGQIVGYEVKSSLQFNWTQYDLGGMYGYVMPTGTTPTGVGDSFVEFGYFGCLVFALIAYLFKSVWVPAVYLNSTVSQLLYIGLLSPAMVGVTHGIGRFLQEAVFQFIVVFWIRHYARVKDPIALSPQRLTSYMRSG